jgi:FixJ family two-component response regulator
MVEPARLPPHQAFRRKLMKTQGELSKASPVVIVVDDDPAIRNSLRFSLEIEGFAVRDYPDGMELLNDRELPRHGCLVIDENMPGMKGLDVDFAIATSRCRPS